MGLSIISIKMETWCEIMDWIQVAQDKAKRPAVVNTAMTFWVT
jgi:hypothetical protein